VQRLQWNAGRGVIELDGDAMALMAPPAVGFVFDALDFVDGAGTVTLSGSTNALAPAQIAACVAYCDRLRGNNRTSRVHAADVLGRYVGVVPEAEAYTVLDGPPPFDPSEAEFDHATRQWRRVQTPARLDTLGRRQRDALLAQSDWTQVADNALTPLQRLAWREYRTALRDLPAHPNWPQLQATDWPTPPA
jgi:hypothetical protein